MNSYFMGYLLLIMYIIGENVGTSSARFRIGRRRKALASMQQNFYMNGWVGLSTNPPEPEFIGDIKGIKIIAGKDAILRCVVENLGDHKITWSHVTSKDVLSIGTNVFKGKNRIDVKTTNHTSWYLHIRNVTQNDTGYYACQISTNPIKSQAVFLDVVEPPEFVTNMTHRNVTVMENQNVTLSCKATGYPSPEIKWRREDGQPFLVGNELVTEYKNEELKFIGVSREHMAAYLCLASNEVPPAISRRIYLDVKFPPLIWIQNQLVGAAEGIDVYLECHTVAHPTSDNYWLRNDEAVVSKSTRYHPHITRTSYKTYMKLTIRELKQEDYGTYQCVAKNEISETQGSIKLYRLVIPTPQTTQPVIEENVPTRKAITVSLTTEYKTLVTDVVRWDGSNTPGKQQKYGLGADEDSSATSRCSCVSVYTVLFAIMFLIVKHIETCNR